MANRVRAWPRPWTGEALLGVGDVFRIKENTPYSRKLCTWQFFFLFCQSSQFKPSAFRPLLLPLQLGVGFLVFFSLSCSSFAFLRLDERPGRPSFGHLLSSPCPHLSFPSPESFRAIIPRPWPFGLGLLLAPTTHFRCWPIQMATLRCVHQMEKPRWREMCVRETAKRRT